MREKFRNFLIFFICIIWVGILFALGITKEAPLGSISGRVVRSDNGRAVEGVKIFHPTRNFFARSDKEGFYILNAVPEGKYNINAYATRYEPAYYYGARVFEGQVAKNINFKMYRARPYFYLYNSHDTFTPLEAPKFILRGYLLKDFSLRLYKIPPELYLKVWQDYTKLKNLKIGNFSCIYQKDLSFSLDDEDSFEDVVNLKLLEEGTYLADLKAKGGSSARRVCFTVSKIGLLVKRSPEEILIYTQDFLTGSPAGGVQLKVYQKDKLFKTGITSKEGLWEGKTFGNYYSYEIMAQKDQSFAFLQVYSSGSASPYKIYLYTERPVYRPGGEVFFKGIFRGNLGFNYRNMPDRKVQVEVKDSNGSNIFKSYYTTDSFGTFNGSFVLPEETALGNFSLTASYSDEKFYREFKVAEYKKPEYSISLESDKKQYVAGEPFVCRVNARYYFGGPVRGAKVRYTVYESSYRGWWVKLDSFRFEEERSYGRIVAEGNVITDEAGTAVLKIPTQKSDYDRLMGVEVEVEDISKKTATSSLSVLVTRGMFDLVIESDKYIYNKDEKIKFSLRTVDYDGKNIGGIKIHAEAFKVNYSEKEGSYEEKLKKAEDFEAVTDTSGNARINFTAKDAGSYKITAYAYDDEKNKIASDWYVWVTSLGLTGNISSSTLQVICDKKQYKPGQTAVVLINLPKPDSYVLLTVEGRKLFLKKLIHVKGNSINYKLPLKEEYLPNVNICATLINGKQFITGQAEIRISPDENFINLEISSNKGKYQPGEEATFNVKAADNKGRPVVCQFSFGLVDEAIYAISPEETEDIKDFFYGEISNYVYTNYSFPQYYSALDKSPEIKIRKKFKDTACFIPDIITSSDGKAAFKVKLPDNLTTWRGTVRAVSMNTKVGSIIYTILAAKDLLVRLEVPRFITQNDELEIAGIVHNYTKGEQKLKIKFKAEGVEVLSPLEIQDLIGPQNEKRYSWKVKAKFAGNASFIVSASSGNLSDAMQLKVPVHPKAIAKALSASDVVDGVKDVQIKFPQNLISSATDFKIYLSPSLACILLQGLDYLASYPYGCVEQTMSAFLPDIMAAKVFKETGLKDASIQRKLPEMVQEGLYKIYRFQHSDGGWGWWDEDITQPYLTAYVMFGLNEAVKAGFEVDKDVFSRGIQCLQGLAKSKPEDIKIGGSRRQNTALCAASYMIYVLSECGKFYPELVLNLYENKDKLDNFAKALLALTMSRDFPEKTKEILAELNKDAVFDEAACYWESDGSSLSWTDSNIETTAYVLKALIRLQPENSKIAKTLNWLVLRRGGIHWVSTKDTAAVIYALCDYLKNTKELSPDYSAKVYFNNKLIKEVKIKEAILGMAESRINIPPELIKNENILKIAKDGTGRLYYSYNVKYYTQEEEIKPQSNGIKISRNYYKLKRKRLQNSWEDVPVPFNAKEDAVEIGERLKVEIILDCQRDYEYVIIEDPLPAGFETVIPEEEKNWGSLWWHRQEVRDEKLVYFSAYLSGGKHTLSYLIRAEIPGTFGVLPSQASCMYLPHIGGNSGETRIVVKQ